jgi:hypothetical protein
MIKIVSRFALNGFAGRVNLDAFSVYFFVLRASGAGSQSEAGL